MQNIRTVPIGEVVATDNTDDVLVAYGLGSCIAICMYDPVALVGGMLHALLPTSPANGREHGNYAKFVDRGIPILIEKLEELGGNHSQLITYLCGGAKMLTIPGEDDKPHIGERNILAAEYILRESGLKIWARATGGNNGRTLKFFIDTGDAKVSSLGQEEKVLSTYRRLKSNVLDNGTMGGNYVYSNGR